MGEYWEELYNINFINIPLETPDEPITENKDVSGPKRKKNTTRQSGVLLSNICVRAFFANIVNLLRPLTILMYSCSPGFLAEVIPQSLDLYQKKTDEIFDSPCVTRAPIKPGTRKMRLQLALKLLFPPCHYPLPN